MSEDIVYNKIETIKRCIRRIREEYNDDPENLKNFTKQDSVVLNLQRACEASIDLAMHLLSELKLGIPQSSRDAFELLYQAKWIDEKLNTRMKAMVGFRNIAVHDYQKVQVDILHNIIEYHLNDFMDFVHQVTKRMRT